jgi:hypothetical protein
VDAGTNRFDGDIQTSGSLAVGTTLSATSATLSQITSLAHYIGGGHTRAQKPVAVWVGETAAAATYPAAWNELGAMYLDTDNYLYICTVAGSPGSWLPIAVYALPCPELCVLEPNPSGAIETRRVGLVLQGLFAQEIAATDSEDVSGNTAATYAIRETQDEISYVTTATLTIDGVVYQPVKYTPPRAKSGGHYEIRKGERLEITFPVAPRADQRVTFSATGYYEIGDNARGWLGAFRNMQKLTLARSKTWVQAREAAIRADAATALAAKQAQIDALKTRVATIESKLAAHGW